MRQGRWFFQNDDPIPFSDVPANQPGAHTWTEQSEAEQVRLLYRQVPAGCVATVLNAGIVAAVLWKVVVHPLLLAWLALLLVIILSLLVLVRLYHRRLPTADRL